MEVEIFVGMRGRKYFNWGGMLLAAWLMISCSKSPENLVETYLDYTFLDSNGEKAYKLLSSEDKKYVGLNEFSGKIKRENLLNKRILEKYEKYFYYEVINISEPSDTVFVTVQLNKPNAMNVLSDLVEYAMSTVFSTLPENQQASAISKKFEAIMMSKDRLLVSEERVFTVIKEPKGYRIFLDLGLPDKQRKQDEKLALLKQQALQMEENMEFDAALKIYDQLLNVKFDEEVADHKLQLENRLQSTLKPGQSKVFGNLQFKSVGFEKRRALIKKNPRDMPSYLEHTMNEYLILTFEVQNVSEGQVFAIEENMPFYAESTITDNFGNIMKELLPEVYTDQIENKTFKLLQPGEKYVFRIACDAPLNYSAKEFTWSINLHTDNKGSKSTAYVLFNRKDIKEEVKFAQG